MRHLRKFLIVLWAVPVAVFWAIIGVRVEPFKSNSWLTMLCAMLSALAVLVVIGLIMWWLRRD